MALTVGGLRHRPAEHDLPGRIEPMAGESVDDLIPDIPLQTIEVLWRFGAATSRKNWDHGEFGGSFAAH